MFNHLATGNGIKALASEGQKGSVGVNEQSSLQQTQTREPFPAPFQGFKGEVSANDKICVFGKVLQHSSSPAPHLNQSPKPLSVAEQGTDGHPDLKRRQENQTEQTVVENCLLVASLHFRLFPKPFLLVVDLSQIRDDETGDAVHNRKLSPAPLTNQLLLFKPQGSAFKWASEQFQLPIRHLGDLLFPSCRRNPISFAAKLGAGAMSKVCSSRGRLPTARLEVERHDFQTVDSMGGVERDGGNDFRSI
jgi:hypothetical protein